MYHWVDHLKITISAQIVYVGGPKRNKTSLNAAERGGVGGQRQFLFPRPSTVSSETDVFL